jgi:ribosome-associated heat shock protein Hsp15
MRVDKFLWSVRYYKTRSKATEAAKKGRVRIDNSIVKPSRDVFPGDLIELRKDQIDYKVEVIDLPSGRVGNKIVDLYRMDRTPKENFDAKKLIALNQDYYRIKGEGRPTKKDRRDLTGILNQEEEEEEE